MNTNFKALEKEREIKQRFEDEYNNLKIDLRLRIEREIEFQAELNTLTRAKFIVDEENRNLNLKNKILEDKLTTATELIEQFNKKPSGDV